MISQKNHILSPVSNQSFMQDFVFIYHKNKK